MSSFLNKLHLWRQKPEVFIRMLSRLYNPQYQTCPSCGEDPEEVVYDRRFFIFALKRCSSCKLLYRTPTDSSAESKNFYQENYIEETVTNLPDANSLSMMIAENFSSKGDLSAYVSLLQNLIDPKEIKLLDFGCSWGYNTWKFRKAGFRAVGVEVSHPRCDFGKTHLGVEAYYDTKDLPQDFNVVFSSHVFEHVPSIQSSFQSIRELLEKQGGIIIIITPNGSTAFRDSRPHRWHELWGRKHPNFLDDVFWHKLLGNIPYALMSRNEDGTVTADLDSLTLQSLESQKTYNMSGEELILIAKIPH